MRPLTSAGCRFAVGVVVVTAVLVPTTSPRDAATRDTAVASRAHAARTDGAQAPPDAVRRVPAALTAEGLGLGAGPVAVPLQLRIPSLGISAAVLGVGVTPKNVMDAPTGPATDPVWQQAFWYRGSAAPGAPSTALFAGHVNDSLGRAGVFAHIGRLRPGDPIVVHDTRSGLDVHFSVTESKTYTLRQATDPAVLRRIYGVGPVAGTLPQQSDDGLSHLTLITCTGTFRNGTHDDRLVVYATRTA